MKTVQHHFFNGPNVWAPQSALLVVLDHKGGSVTPLAWRPGAAELQSMLGALRAVFPGLEDFNSAAPMQNFLLALPAQLTRDFCIRPLKGRLIGHNGTQLQFLIPCDTAVIALAAWDLTLEAANALLGLPPDKQHEIAQHLRGRYKEFREFARSQGLNQTTIAIARVARARGIPTTRLSPPGQFMQLGQGKHRLRVNETNTDKNSALALSFTRDKFAMAAFLTGQGIPTPSPMQAATAQDAALGARRIGYPVVVKPRSASKGRGVSVGMTSDESVIQAFDAAARYKTGVLVERFIPGEDHRLLVVGGRFVAAARRVPAAVVGDGQRTVAQLIERLNRDPRRGLDFERLLEYIVVDQEARQLLTQAGLTLQDVPAKGRAVPLRLTANISRGGTAVDVTDVIHPDNIALAERVAQLSGLDITGIDFMTPDITQSWRNIRCGILEVNASPGLRPHMASNAKRDVVRPIVEHLFPDGADGRVPTAGVTGSVGKTTTCTLVAHILSEAGLTTARCTTQGAWVGKEVIRIADVAGGNMASALLQDSRVDAGVFELARGGLIKKGMTLDALDVGAVLNVLDNHVGIDGVQSREDLARVKRLVVQNARKLAVLNADDPLCLAMREHVKAPVCLVSLQQDNAAVHAHQQAGGMVAITRGEGPTLELLLCQGDAVIGQMHASDIPITYNATFRPAIHNALFAMSMAHGMGLDYAAIRAGLSTFRSTPQANPGRMNFVENLPHKMLVTWVEGKEAMGALAQFVRAVDVPGKKVMVFLGIGNRPDAYLQAMAHTVSGSCDRYICTDWDDLRGRQSGEVAQLMADTLVSDGVPGDAVEVVPLLDPAVERGLDLAEPGDLLVVATFDGPRAIAAAQRRYAPPAGPYVG